MVATRTSSGRSATTFSLKEKAILELINKAPDLPIDAAAQP